MSTNEVYASKKNVNKILLEGGKAIYKTLFTVWPHFAKEKNMHTFTCQKRLEECVPKC